MGNRSAAHGSAQLWWLATAGAAHALRHDHLIGNIAPRLEADLILIDRAATPLLARRTARCENIPELLFALSVLGGLVALLNLPRV